MATEHWAHFPHEADMGVRGIGSTLEQAFEQAALAMTAVVTDPATVILEQMIPLACEAPDVESLLVDWLNALIYEMATRSMLFSHFEVRLEEQRLTAQAWGEALDQVRHQADARLFQFPCTRLKVTGE